MRAWLILAILLIGTGRCAAAVEAVNIYEPRAFGYFIGDTFERRVEVITTGDTELLTAGLPRPGPLTYWLELTGIEHTVREADGRKIHDITLKYQTFYAALEPVKVKIPPYPLKFRNAGTTPAPQELDVTPAEGEIPVPPPQDVALIPSFQIVMSPIREYAVSDFMSGKSVEIADIMAPDAKAHLIDTSRETTLLGVGLAALALSSLLLLWHYAKGPFARRQGRPFTIADRRIRELQTTESSDTLYRDSLIALHRAFDESYGRRLFAEDLSAFLSKRQRFSVLQERLQKFFESSRIFFFSENKHIAETKFPIEDVRELAADLAREEKAAA
jgi:mxaA protein